MALNSTQMQDVKITGNTFYGVRMMVGGNLTVTGNQFFRLLRLCFWNLYR